LHRCESKYDHRHVTGFRFRLIDTAGSELAIVSYAVPNVREGDTVHLPDGRGAQVVEVYADEEGQEGNVKDHKGLGGAGSDPLPRFSKSCSAHFGQKRAARLAHLSRRARVAPEPPAGAG
jgi:hypothetical protein